MIMSPIYLFKYLNLQVSDTFKVSDTLAILFFISLTTLAVGQSHFADVTTSTGLLPMTGSEGIAVGDFNNDGYDDFYVCSISSKNQLYQNNGNGIFTEIAEVMGLDLDEDTYTQAAVWGDLNNDGWLDLYVANKATADNVFLNKGDNTFEDISFWAGIYHLGFPKSVNLADINNDGWLDIYISNFNAENVMYLNNGDETFSNYTMIAGALDDNAAMGTIFFDYDKDGDVDLYLVHDHFEPNFLYQNDGTGVFTEVGAIAGVNTESFGMGVDVGDFNRDGWLDIYMANFGKNFLLLNNGDGTFIEMAEEAAVEDTGMGWGCIFLDYDNDGWEDIYVANAYVVSPIPNVLYKNLENTAFEKVEQAEAISNHYNSYGTASLDYNLDGQMDVLVANRGTGESLQLFKNPERTGNWVSFKLIGTNSNRSAIGAKIQLIDDLGHTHYQELNAGQSWSSQNSSLLHFGLGEANTLEQVLVSWPLGQQDTFFLLEANQFYSIHEGLDIQEGIVFDVPTTISDNIEEEHFQLNVFPNPNQGNFTMSFYQKEKSSIRMEVYNLLGQLVFSKIIETSVIGKNDISIQLPPALSNQVLSVQLVSNQTYNIFLIVE